MSENTLHARDLLTAEVVTVPPGMPVTSLARLLADRGISSAPVVDDHGRLLGVVTEADLLRRLAGTEDVPVGWLQSLFQRADPEARQYARTHGTTAQDIMTRDLVTVRPDATAAHCASLMETHRIKRLPVIRDGRLAGIVSRADLLRAVLDPEVKVGADAPSRDAHIRAALRTEMRSQSWTHHILTFADVQDGVVTLHGHVQSDAMRQGLHVLVGRLDGVVRLDDYMTDRMTDAPVIALPDQVAGQANGVNGVRPVLL